MGLESKRHFVGMPSLKVVCDQDFSITNDNINWIDFPKGQYLFPVEKWNVCWIKADSTAKVITTPTDIELSSVIALTGALVEEANPLTEIAVNNFADLTDLPVQISNIPTVDIGNVLAFTDLPVQISNQPTVDIGNLPASQTIDGAVSVSNFPATQPVSGNVSVSNLPSIQTVRNEDHDKTDKFIQISGSSGEDYKVPSGKIYVIEGYQVGARDNVSTLPYIYIENSVGTPRLYIFQTSTNGGEQSFNHTFKRKITMTVNETINHNMSSGSLVGVIYGYEGDL